MLLGAPAVKAIFSALSERDGQAAICYFYCYKPPRPLEEIDAGIRVLERDIVRMLADVTGTEPEEIVGEATRPHHTRRTKGLDPSVLTRDSEYRGSERYRATGVRIAAFLNTGGGDLLLGVADDGSIVGIERDGLASDDEYMRHLAQVVRNGLGDRAGTRIDPKTQIAQGRTVCVVTCERSPEPVFLRWKRLEASPEGDFYVRSAGTVKLPPDSAAELIRTNFPSAVKAAPPADDPAST